MKDKSSKKTTKKNETETETEENKTEETSNSASHESTDKHKSDIENTETLSSVNIKKETESDKVPDEDLIFPLNSEEKKENKPEDKENKSEDKENKSEDKENKSEDYTPAIDIKTLQEINESSLK